jgi:hypothetical protein
MIEQGLFKRHFVGRDGFQWWIGQIPDADTWKDNLPGKNVNNNADPEYLGYGERYRVRIMGYHTADKTELPDEELPWATLMYPVTAGGGGGSASQTSNITQGTFVYGFFLDGEDGQQPVIMGCIGYNDYTTVMKNVPDVGFVPFRGLPAVEPIPAGARPVVGNGQTLRPVSGTVSVQGQGASATSTVGATVSGQENQSPESAKTIKDRVTLDASDENTEALAQPTTCEKVPVSKIQQSIRSLIRDVEKARKSLYDAEQGALDDIADKERFINKKIEEAAEKISANIKWIYTEIEKFVLNKTNEALKFAYDIAFPNERGAVKTASNNILETISCFFRKLIGQLVQLMVRFLKDAIDRVINVSKCFVENFVGNIFGALSGIIDGLFSGLESLISGAVDIADGALGLGGDVLGLVDDLISFLSCDEPPKCSNVNEWNIITGGNQLTSGDINTIVERAKDISSQTQQLGLDALNNFNTLTDIDFGSVFNVDGCNLREQICSAPILEFFNSDGSGAAGNLVIGAAGDIIGVDMLSFGDGYDENTKAKVIDICGKGSGAVLRPVFGRVPTDGTTPTGGVGGGTPATSPPNIGFGPFQPQNYPFPNGVGPALAPFPFLPSLGGSSPLYGVGPSAAPNAVNQDNCIDVEFTVNRAADLSNTITFRLVDAEPGFINGWDYTGDDVSDGETKGGATYIECVVPGKDYLVSAFLPDGSPTINPLRIDSGGSTVRMDDQYRIEDEVIVEEITREVEDTTPTTPIRYTGLNPSNSPINVVNGGKRINYKDGQGSDSNAIFTIVSGNATFTSDGRGIIGSGSIRLRLEWDDDPDAAGRSLQNITINGITWSVTSSERGDQTETINIETGTKTITETIETRAPRYESDFDYLDLVVTAGSGKFSRIKGNTCIYRLDPPGEPDGPGDAQQLPEGAGAPTVSPILIPSPAPIDAGVGIVDVLVVQSGGNYLSRPDGSKGGDGRTWANSNDTVVIKQDGRIEVPIPPDNVFCVEAGDIVELPPGTSVVTETNNGQGGGERIVGGSPHTMVLSGCFTTPQADYQEPESDAYPVILYLCDIVIESPGFNYRFDDEVIIEPNRGAEAELEVDRFGRVIAVKVTQPGEGFKELPEVYIKSDTGYNAVLLPKLCIDKDVELDDPEKIVQVVDCVGKF